MAGIGGGDSSPTKKGRGCRQSFNLDTDGGAGTIFWVVSTQALAVLAMVRVATY